MEARLEPPRSERSVLFQLALASSILIAAVLAACSGDDGESGAEGPPGEPGPPGAGGSAGAPSESSASFDITITHVGIGADGVTDVAFTVADAEGVPLEVGAGGVSEPRFVLGYLAADSAGKPTRYVPLTTTSVTSPITGQTATLPSSDSGGAFSAVKGAPGQYVYRFGKSILVEDPAATHTVGVWAAREINGVEHVDNETFHFVPGGGDPVVRELVTDKACNSCHGQLKAHGGDRRDVQLCTICHTEGFSDPDTGSSIDFRVMVHKIHRGEDLPSVQAGDPYQIIGFQQSVHDYSTVVFPHSINNCISCHQGAQAERWRTHPTRAACGACHDRTAFDLPAPAGFEPHPGTEQLNDAECLVCHKTNGLASIEDAHRVPELDPASPDVELEILSVTNTGPGEVPELLFSVKVDGAPRDLIAAPLTRLAVTLAGPTTDYAGYVTYTIQGMGAAGALVPDGANFRYRFPQPIPATARGSYAVGMEGYLQASSDAPRFAAFNPVVYVAVSDAEPVPRREIVEQGNCNNCHLELSAHGGQRRNVEYCLLCHQPGNTNDERISRPEGEPVIAQSVNLKPMIHSIHMGELLSQPYVLGTFPAPSETNPAGAPHDFSEVRYPRSPAECVACHNAGTTLLPLPPGLLPSRSETLVCTEDPALDANDYCDARTSTEHLTPPESSACVSCHDSPATKAHAELMTTPSGAESCATCHAPGGAFDAERAHAQAVEP